MRYLFWVNRFAEIHTLLIVTPEQAMPIRHSSIRLLSIIRTVQIKFTLIIAMICRSSISSSISSTFLRDNEAFKKVLHFWINFWKKLIFTRSLRFCNLNFMKFNLKTFSGSNAFLFILAPFIGMNFTILSSSEAEISISKPWCSSHFISQFHNFNFFQVPKWMSTSHVSALKSHFNRIEI